MSAGLWATTAPHRWIVLNYAVTQTFGTFATEGEAVAAARVAGHCFAHEMTAAEAWQAHAVNVADGLPADLRAGIAAANARPVEINGGPTPAVDVVPLSVVLDAFFAQGYVRPVSGDHRPSATHPRGRVHTLEELAAWERSEMGRPSRFLEGVTA